MIGSTAATFGRGLGESQSGSVPSDSVADWTLSLRDEHGDITEVTVTEEQARAFMAGQPVAYWSSAPEEVGMDRDTDRLYDRHDARERDHEHEEERE
jgi:hypothetical protein